MVGNNKRNEIGNRKLNLYNIKYGLYTRDYMPLALSNFWDVWILIACDLIIPTKNFVLYESKIIYRDTVKLPVDMRMWYKIVVNVRISIRYWNISVPYIRINIKNGIRSPKNYNRLLILRLSTKKTKNLDKGRNNLNNFNYSYRFNKTSCTNQEILYIIVQFT